MKAVIFVVGGDSEQRAVSPYGGGGSGYVRSGEYDLTFGGRSVSVTVGVGGEGSSHKVRNSTQDRKAGGASFFGSYLYAGGGLGIIGDFYSGADGWSGGVEGMNRASYCGQCQK